MQKDFYSTFLKSVILIAPINAAISVSSLYLQSGWVNEVFEWVVGILNFPTIWFVANCATSFLKSPDVNWYVTTIPLSLFGSLFWGLIIAIVKIAATKNQGTEQIAGDSTGKR